jgi:RHS repeat-associated protein
MDDTRRIALVETRILGKEPDAPAQLIRYQFGNHLGSSSLELDDHARVISYEEYTPYGSTSYQAVQKDIELPLKRYRYTGKERDEESGLYYHGARYYAAWLGRWVNCDSLEDLWDGINLFAYVQARPINFTDASGNSSVPFQAAPASGITPPGPTAPPPAAVPYIKKGEQAQAALIERIEAKGHGVKGEVTIKGGKGGSRIDIAPDPTAPQTIGKTIESKYINLSKYRDDKGQLDTKRLKATIGKHVKQVVKHKTALSEGVKPDLPFDESLVYSVENAEGQLEQFRGLVREVATPKGVRSGVVKFTPPTSPAPGPASTAPSPPKSSAPIKAAACRRNPPPWYASSGRCRSGESEAP